MGKVPFGEVSVMNRLFRREEETDSERKSGILCSTDKSLRWPLRMLRMLRMVLYLFLPAALSGLGSPCSQTSAPVAVGFGLAGSLSSSSPSRTALNHHLAFAQRHARPRRTESRWIGGRTDAVGAARGVPALRNLSVGLHRGWTGASSKFSR